MPSSLALAPVLDCSAIVSWYADDEDSRVLDDVLRQLKPDLLHVPALWIAEFANALRSMQKRKRIDTQQRDTILEHSSRLPLAVDGATPDLHKISTLSSRYDLSAYDATYLELAQRLQQPLVTLDKALAKAAIHAKLTVYTTNSKPL